MEMKEAFRPGILLFETHYPLRGQKGVMGDAVARVADEGFYQGIEIPDIEEARERRVIADLSAKNDIKVTQWMSRVLDVEKLNLSSLVEAERKRSVNRLLQLMAGAAECGATSFAVLSGPDPGPDKRAEAIARLTDSLQTLCQNAAQYPGMQVIIEPLDREAHKNALLGPVPEAVAFIRRLQELGVNPGISWDSAHVALCREDVLASLANSHEFVTQLHMANAILDRAHPGFGDHHMPPGPPGFLTAYTMADIFQTALKVGFFGRRRPIVSVEMRTPADGDPWETERIGRRVLQEAWAIVTES